MGSPGQIPTFEFRILPYTPFRYLYFHLRPNAPILKLRKGTTLRLEPVYCQAGGGRDTRRILRRNLATGWRGFVLKLCSPRQALNRQPRGHSLRNLRRTQKTKPPVPPRPSHSGNCGNLIRVYYCRVPNPSYVLLWFISKTQPLADEFPRFTSLTPAFLIACSLFMVFFPDALLVFKQLAASFPPIHPGLGGVPSMSRFDQPTAATLV